ncbi:hypothetical protein Zmor_014904 [Zophobas morio]|uniref:Putative nuclease HARBI1 n=1 Tax=Zophobas morio TaxID=2755281 RepID=A0AA38MGS2_9CUCU|nr:hypothetical protein Zmor_014904 [Zophobas morio]
MSAEKLDLLLNEIGPLLLHNTSKSGALTPKQQLSVALHWLGCGAQNHIVGDAHGVDKSTVCRTVQRVVNVVNDVLLNRIVRWPENIPNEIEKFYRIAHFPHVCGVVDGSLIPIDAPTNNEPAFVDRWGGHSINCMFVCGATKFFYYVSANCPGSVHDARVMRNSNLYRRFERQNIFPNAVILGDSAYPLKQWLMPPRHNNPNNPLEERYNRRHKGTRQVIEGALGILKEKFPCLHHLRVEPRYAANIVKCCTTLCNFARIGVNDDEVEVLNENNLILQEDENIVLDHPEREIPIRAAILRQEQILNLMNN